MVGVSVSLGMLLLAGAAVGGYVLLKDRLPGTAPAAAAPAPGTPAAPAPAQNTVAVGNGVVVPVGTGSASWNTLQQQLQQQQAQEAAYRRQQQIDTLERDFAACINEIKRLTDQLNTIDASPMPPDIIAEVLRQRKAFCMTQRPGWWIMPDYDCRWITNLEGDDGKWQKIAEDMLAARKAEQRRPILVRLSELNAQQKAIVQNLAGLGVTKQPVNVRTA